MKTKTNYAEKKEFARQMAIEWQANAADKDMSYAELEEAGHYFYNLGKRYGLLREFRENAIPC